jgi:hypothetical protein
MGAPCPPDWQQATPDAAPRRSRLLSRYEVFGPFELPAGTVDGDAGQAFWHEVDGRRAGLSEAYGCFVLSVRSRGARSELPWYVGRADRRPFRATCLDPQRQAIYAEVLRRLPRIAAYLHLVCRVTPGGRFSRPTLFTRREIAFIEGLIGHVAQNRNPRLRVDEQQLLAHSLAIPGLLGSHNVRLTLDERALRAVLGL